VFTWSLDGKKEEKYWTKAIWYLIMGFLAMGIAGPLGICTAIYLWLVTLAFVALQFLAAKSF